MPVPLPPPPARTLLDNVADITRLAEETGPLLEQQHRLTPELAEALSTAGFARHFVPARWGGTAGDFATATAASALLGECCTSTAWCASLYAAHGRLAAYLPEAGQRDLWAASPDVRIAAAIVPPPGGATRVPGGWRLSGRWAPASGADHAHWALLAADTDTDGGGRERRIFALPRTDYEVLDTWRNMGLKGTGSNTVAVKGAVVPAYRSFTLAGLDQVRPGVARCHAVPLKLVSSLQFAAPILGATRAALRIWTADMAARRSPDGRPARDLPTVQQVLARSSADIHVAGLLMEYACRRADHAEPTPLTVAENLRDLAVAADLCATAAGQLLRASGAHAQRQTDPMQRRWLDVISACGHAALDLNTAATLHAHATFPS
ncbi:acyl-CoA dehydrogenase family protein [Streptomyces sp. NPDC092296]|uniref:acyl-CoA dehydrogenase family protein n=1 Tax=Streptomyces sp. NPDC092296 TaxID=3366012 RepID=UPI00381169ED